MAFESNDPARLAALAALGLGPDAKARDIISAYRRLARLNHPDMSAGQPPANHSFADISDAYHFLTRGAGRASPGSPASAPGADAPLRPDAEARPLDAQPLDAQPDTPPDPMGDRGYFRLPYPDAEPMFEAGPVIIRPLPPESR